MRSRSSLAFRGGLGAAWSWFAAFVGGMLWIASQAADPLAFWPILLATLGLGLLLAVDRHAYLAEALAGAGRESVLLLAAAWPLAAILAQTLRLSGLPASLVNIAEPLGLVGMPYVLAAFVLVATASVVGGSALAALALVAPLLYVTGDALGVATAPLAGALLAGAAFGDHLSPIAEVSVAAAITQRPNLAQLAATRLSWALAPGLASAVAFALLVPNPPPPNSLPSGDPRALLLLAAPALALWILRRRRHLVEATAFGAAAAVSIALLADRLTVDELLRFEGARLDGGLLDAAEQGAELSIVLVSIAAVMRVARSAGLPQSFFRLLRPRHPARAPRRRDEARLVLAMFGGTAMTVHPSGAALALGDEMRHTGRLTAVPALRRAHLLEVTIRALPFLLP
ncbi:MAG: Na+/H+ antiporter NhaC family protein, partial [Acidobacteriota bacterium]